MSPNVTRFGLAEGPSRRGFKGAGGFGLDMSQVMRNMALLNVVVMPAKIKVGLTLAGSKFMIDCLVESPTVPIKRPGYAEADREAGELRASGALFVDGVKKGSTQHYGEMATGKFQPTSYGGTPILPMSHEACVVFNALWAATQHESFPDKTEPTAGRYFMSTKLYGNAVEYMSILARAIKL